MDDMCFLAAATTPPSISHSMTSSTQACLSTSRTTPPSPPPTTRTDLGPGGAYAAHRRQPTVSRPRRATMNRQHRRTQGTFSFVQRTVRVGAHGQVSHELLIRALVTLRRLDDAVEHEHLTKVRRL